MRGPFTLELYNAPEVCAACGERLELACSGVHDDYWFLVESHDLRAVLLNILDGSYPQALPDVDVPLNWRNIPYDCSTNWYNSHQAPEIQ